MYLLRLSRLRGEQKEGRVKIPKGEEEEASSYISGALKQAKSMRYTGVERVTM
jgi:hypothetical protein